MKNKTVWILALIAVGDFLLRVLPHLTQVFANGYVNYYDPDSAYHMRLVEYMVANFPHFLTFDPYAVYPDGGVVGYRPVLTFITAGISLVLGLGHPSHALMEQVSAWIPPVLGSLLVVPVYFLGKYAFGRVAGIVGAVLVAFMPSELFARSTLGAFDHHILEVIFAVCTILFLVMAERKEKWWLASLAGAFLGLYLLNWHGGMFLAGIILAWYILGVFIGYSRPGHVFLCFLTAFVVTLPIIPYSITKLEWVLLPMAFIPVAVNLIYQRASRMKLNYWAYRGMIAVFILVAGIVMWKFYPQFYTVLKAQLQSIFWGFGSTIMEAQPSEWYQVIYQFGFPLVLALVGLLIGWKDKSRLLFLVWTVVVVVAMIGQRRWAYYTAVPVGILSGYVIGLVLENTGKMYKVAISVLAGIVILGSLVPGIWNQARSGPFEYSNWVKAYQWIRENSPEPFDPNGLAYYYSDLVNPGVYDPDNPDYFDYIPAYGVLSWWDYGHFCIYYGHRVPLSSNTFQISQSVGQFLLSQNLEMSELAIKGLNVKYVVLSAEMVQPGGTFYAIYNQVMGSMDGWQKALDGSMAYNLYIRDELGPWKFVYSVQDVRIYERE